MVDSKKTYFGGFLGGKEELKVGNPRHFPGGKRKTVTAYQEPFQNSFLENIFTKLFFRIYLPLENKSNIYGELNL